MNNIFWFTSLVFMDSIHKLISMPKVAIFYHAVIILKGCICGCNCAQNPDDKKSNYTKFQYCLEIENKKQSLTVGSALQF